MWRHPPAGSDVWVALTLQVHVWGDVPIPCVGASSVVAAPLLPPKPPRAVTALALSVPAAAMPLFVLQTYPVILPCCWSCCSAPVGAGRGEWGGGGGGSLLQHQAPPRCPQGYGSGVSLSSAAGFASNLF